MRKFWLFVFSSVCLTIAAQSKVGVDAPDIKTWRITDAFATVDTVAVDTNHLNFQFFNHVDRNSISNAFLGNLGLPLTSKLYFDRPESTDEFIFSDVYNPYIRQISNQTFYNTKTPFSSLYYLSGGTNYHEEEQIRFLFTANANKKLNFGVELDYIYARGEYANSAAKRFTGNLFGTYDGERYKATGAISTNNLSHFESGGIQSTDYINGDIIYPTYNIPVNIEGYANYKHSQLFFNHQYAVGIYRRVQVSKDSVGSVFVPVTRFSHTLQIDDKRKRYFENAVEKTFYDQTYLSGNQTNDTSALQRMTNRFSVSIEEEFNKWMQFGLKAYVENEIRNFTFNQDSLVDHLLESNTSIGAVLSKERGKHIRYNANGHLVLIGPDAGDMTLDAALGGYFKLWKDSVVIKAHGFTKSITPSYFLNYYHSNHFKWENEFIRTLRTRLGGTLAIPTKGFAFTANVENLYQMIYFNQDALPAQFDGNVQVISARLSQDLHLGKITLENEGVYQLSSHQEILPLPTLTLFHNLYYHDKWFDVLSMQIGVNARYHTAYFAPSYMPATGRFYNQSDVKIGNYPVFNVYLNAHLKRTRFFAEIFHVNQWLMKGDYYSIPLYPINPAIFKVGLTWNFYD